MRDPLNATFADSNHYALPLSISPVYSTAESKVIRIDIVPTGNDHTIRPVAPYEIKPPSEYTSEHQTLRTDLKPLNVVQPEGVSFKYQKIGETGEIVEWQKWFFRIGFNAREGTVLYDASQSSIQKFSRSVDSRRSAMMADPFSIASPYPI